MLTLLKVKLNVRNMGNIEISKAIELAGGPAFVAKACTNRDMPISTQAVRMWAVNERLPSSEYRGTTSYSRVISDLMVAGGHLYAPGDFCHGALQYNWPLKQGATA